MLANRAKGVTRAVHSESVLERLREVYKHKGITGIAHRVVAKCFWYFYSPFANMKQLAKRHGTDKGATYHTFNGINYLDLYEQHFKAFKYKHIKLLEIGVYGGASLRMWKEYFPNG